MAVETQGSGRSASTPRKRLPSLILKTLAFFVILEPLWMLLPFAGFLYGSVMHIETLSRNPYTALLVHFVLPTHTLFPLGLLLILAGLVIFLVGAFQIYSGKIAGKGLIRTGIYRKFRHPQYLALTVFGIGIILTWGRLITFIAFFVMLWLYYFLAKNEEERCLELFGNEYENYRAETLFLFPGEKNLLARLQRFKPKGIPRWAGIVLSFFFVLFMATAGGLLITELRARLRDTLPAVVIDYPLRGRNGKAVPILLVKGPALQAAPVEEVRDRFMKGLAVSLNVSATIRKTLGQIDYGSNAHLLVFPTPGPDWYSTSHRDNRSALVNLFIFEVESPVPYREGNFREFRRNWRGVQLIRIEKVKVGGPHRGLDPVSGPVKTEEFKPRMEERIDFFLSGL